MDDTETKRIIRELTNLSDEVKKVAKALEKSNELKEKELRWKREKED
jgi:hypothetical protein